MSKTRNLSDLLDANGDVKSTALDNVPASNDASALTTGTLDSARLGTVTNFTSTGIDDNATSTAVTIDSSQNVLVGKTSQDSGATVGTEILSGRVFLRRSGGAPIIADRDTDDGEVAVFKRGGSTVGSIGSYLGSGVSQFYISGADTGFKINSTVDVIAPSNASGANRDNAITLGDSGNRFANLYLGGNIYLGGTGSANALDDYEEGTWTPTFTYVTTTPSFSYSGRYGRYTKIGRMVHIGFQVYVTSVDVASASGDIEITGLPFTAKNPSLASGAVMHYNIDTFSNTVQVNVNVQDNSTAFRFMQSRDNEGWINVSTSNDASTMIFQGSFTYDTDS